MLCDKQGSACILHYASYKRRRVARSVLGAETYAFADACDFAYCAKRYLESILDRTVPLEIYTNSRSLFDVLTKCSQTQERRLMIYLQGVWDAYKSQEISNIRGCHCMICYALEKQISLSTNESLDLQTQV